MLFLGSNPTLPVALKGQKIILKGTSLFLKYGAIPDAFSFIFLFFSFQQQLQLEKSVDGVLLIRTWGHRKVGVDKTTELW